MQCLSHLRTFWSVEDSGRAYHTTHNVFRKKKKEKETFSGPKIAPRVRHTQLRWQQPWERARERSGRGRWRDCSETALREGGKQQSTESKSAVRGMTERDWGGSIGHILHICPTQSDKHTFYIMGVCPILERQLLNISNCKRSST